MEGSGVAGVKDGTATGGILDPPKAPKSKKITKTLKLKLLVNSRKHD